MTNFLFSEKEANGFIGQRIKAVREKLGVSQQALAAAIGDTPQDIDDYETGRIMISAAALVQIANRLNTTAGQLAGTEPSIVGPA